MSLLKASPTLLLRRVSSINPELLFILSTVVVNGGNYLYNIYLGRALGPVQFAEAGMLVTMLLVISFLGMTFQLVTAKYSALLDQHQLASFYGWSSRIAKLTGMILGLALFVGAPLLAKYFNTANYQIFQILALGMPFYFLLSVKRGALQGQKAYAYLSSSYQTEMWSRLLLTVLLIYINVWYSSIVVSWGITISIIIGYLTLGRVKYGDGSWQLMPDTRKMVVKFFLFTAFYEVVQIIINYSDILLVKHYFTAYDAGIYTSIALIGRMIYFIAWMFVMLLLPDVVSKKKDKRPHKIVLFKYLGGISLFAFSIVLACFFFPSQVVDLIFGSGYEAAAPLLWKYALATAFFAISNVFVYYYMSTDEYRPVILSFVFASIQLVLYHLYHANLEQMIIVQIVGMGSLLLANLIFFLLPTKSTA